MAAPLVMQVRTLSEICSICRDAVDGQIDDSTDHMLDVLSELLLHKTDTAVEAKLHGGTKREVSYWLDKKNIARQKFSWSFQSKGHLGSKMADAFTSAFCAGTDVAVVIGSDIPAISVDILEAALKMLENPSCQMVLGPAQDGGYYLVGLRAEVKQKLGNLNCLFEGIEWSTMSVCQQQVRVAKQLGVAVELMPQILQDVDNAEDLTEFERVLGLSSAGLKAPVLSIVIPTLNEETCIKNTLQSLTKNSLWPSYLDIIISDGGSTDHTVQKVEEFTQKNPDLKIRTVQGNRGRGRQLNAGAQEATGTNLLFLHADTLLPPAFDCYVLLTLAEPGNVAGAFRLGWDVLYSPEDERNKCGWWIKAQLWLVTVLHWISLYYTERAYGDQALFMSRRTFERVGRFSPHLLMEDYEIVGKLLKYGHLRTLQDMFVITSARRMIKKGVLKAASINLLMLIGYNIGIHPDTLGRIYYG